MKIKVTTTDIEKASENRDYSDNYVAGSHCPVALATKRALEDEEDIPVYDISAGYGEIAFYVNLAQGGCVSLLRNTLLSIYRDNYPVPKEVEEFMTNFDKYLDVEPIEFEVPDEHILALKEEISNRILEYRKRIGK